jgi:hypothetical protein
MRKMGFNKFMHHAENIHVSHAQGRNRGEDRPVYKSSQAKADLRFSREIIGLFKLSHNETLILRVADAISFPRDFHEHFVLIAEENASVLALG